MCLCFWQNATNQVPVTVQHKLVGEVERGQRITQPLAGAMFWHSVIVGVGDIVRLWLW